VCLSRVYINNFNRDYSSIIGRYNTVDPIELDVETNLYLYSDNNPLVRVDPTGEFWVYVVRGCSMVYKVWKTSRKIKKLRKVCDKIYNGYKIPCSLPGCKSATTCAQAKLGLLNTTACFTGREAYRLAGCDFISSPHGQKGKPAPGATRRKNERKHKDEADNRAKAVGKCIKKINKLCKCEDCN